MSTYYTVRPIHLLCTAVATAIIGSSIVIGYMQYKEKEQLKAEKALLPEVKLDNDGKCVKVINFKNGDAYNCNDVDIVLREYNKS